MSRPSTRGRDELPAGDLDRVFHALGDSTRRAILETLSEGPISVSRLAAPMDVSLAAVMQHLQILEDCGLVKTEKVGRTRTCSLAHGGLAGVERWIVERKTTWERRMERLDTLLQEP